MKDWLDRFNECTELHFKAGIQDARLCFKNALVQLHIFVDLDFNALQARLNVT